MATREFPNGEHEEPCVCNTARGRAQCMCLTHGPHVYRMILLWQFSARCQSYEFRATSMEEATVIARAAAPQHKSWFIRVSEVVYPKVQT